MLTDVQLYPTCCFCSKKVFVVPCEPCVVFERCHRNMLFNKCGCGFDGTFDLELKGEQTSLTVFAVVLSELFKKISLSNIETKLDRLLQKSSN